MTEDKELNRLATDPVKPGPLRDEGSYVILHTRPGVALWDGREGSKEKKIAPIFGVGRFSGSAGQIYRAASADDPWADWWLIKIDEKIAQARASLERYGKQIDELIPKNRNIKIKHTDSAGPVERDLQFPTPSYPYRIAYLIIDFDELCSTVLGMSHRGLLPKSRAHLYIDNMGKPIRAALGCTAGYRFRGVTRSDLLANNPKAQEATLLMNEVPKDIFEGKQRSPDAPILQNFDSDNQAVDTTHDEPIQDDEATIVDPIISNPPGKKAATG